MLKQKRFWLGLGITGLFLFLVFRQVDFNELTTALIKAEYGWLLPALAIYLAGYWIRALGWKYLIKSVKPISWQALMPPLILGFMVNNVLPARAGEFVRAYIVGKREGISKTSVFSTVVMQRIFDGLVMALFAFVVLALFTLDPAKSNAEFVQVMNMVINITAGLFVLLFVVLFITITWKEKMLPIINSSLKIVPLTIRPKVEKILHSFIDGFSVLKSRQDSMLVFLFSVFAWLAESTAYYFVMIAFGIQLPFFAAIMLMAVVNLGIMVPSSPGYIGPFEFFGIGTLMLFGIQKSLALPCILVIHALVWLPITLWGFYYMWTLKLSFKEMEDNKGK